jgi:hypothetical protein
LTDDLDSEQMDSNCHPAPTGGGPSSARSTLPPAASGYQVSRRAVSATFIAFCEQLWPPTQRAGRGGDLRRRHPPPLQPRQTLACRPSPAGGAARARYSPHGNPVERIWATLKAHLANSPTLTIQGRVRQVHAFFRERTPAQMLATAAPSS